MLATPPPAVTAPDFPVQRTEWLLHGYCHWAKESNPPKDVREAFQDFFRHQIRELIEETDRLLAGLYNTEYDQYEEALRLIKMMRKGLSSLISSFERVKIAKFLQEEIRMMQDHIAALDELSHDFNQSLRLRKDESFLRVLRSH